jgi:ANTAR domain
MTQLDKPGLLARLARVVATADGGDPLEVRLCRAFVAILGGEGAAMTLAYTRPERVTLCATDDTSARLEDLQDVLGEGPGVEAYLSGTLTVADLRLSEQPWPLFAEAARKAAGPVMMYAVPMKPGHEVLGVLTVYQYAAMVPEQAEALFLGDAIGAALLRDPVGHETDVQAGPWSTRAGIHQATGMVTAQLRVSPADALALLRAHAYAHDTTLGDVAEQILQRRLIFSTDDDGESEIS